MIVEETLAVAELARYGHGLVPVLDPKKSRYPSSVSGALILGGLVPASASLWKEVRTIQSTGMMKMTPITQASRPSSTPLVRLLRVRVVVAATGRSATAVVIRCSPHVAATTPCAGP